MEKLLLLSVVVMLVVLPIRAARVSDPARSLRKALTHVFAFNVAYWVAVVFVWFLFLNDGDPSKLLHPVQR